MNFCVSPQSCASAPEELGLPDLRRSSSVHYRACSPLVHKYLLLAFFSSSLRQLFRPASRSSWASPFRCSSVQRSPSCPSCLRDSLSRAPWLQLRERATKRTRRGQPRNGEKPVRTDTPPNGLPAGVAKATGRMHLAGCIIPAEHARLFLSPPSPLFSSRLDDISAALCVRMLDATLATALPRGTQDRPLSIYPFFLVRTGRARASSERDAGQAIVPWLTLCQQEGTSTPIFRASSAAASVVVLPCSSKRCRAASRDGGGPRSRNSRGGGRRSNMFRIQVTRENIT